MQQSDRAPGRVCTFYSYKGGVGRSMAVANVAALLARRGRKVLVVDWDLEAPGLEKFFGKYLEGSRTTTPGLLDLVHGYSNGTPLDWRKCLLTVAVPQGEKVSLLHAGKDEPAYVERLRSLDWDALFREKDLGRTLDALREEWITEYELVLIDSRTGITDIGGICSILMPEYLVCLFTTNEQSLAGVRDTMMRARKAHAALELDRRRLIVIPIPARDESHTEYQLALEWRRRFAKELAQFYNDWIPKDETPDRVLDYLKVPYVAYWSFGEKLPVLEEETDNPKKLAYSYAIIASLIDSRLDWTEVKQGRQDAEAEARKAAEAALSERRKEQKLEDLEVGVRYRYLELISLQRKKLFWFRLLTLLFLVVAGSSFGLALIGFPSKYLTILGTLVGGVSIGVVLWAFLRWRRSGALIKGVEKEQAAFSVGVGVYTRLNREAALRLLASRIGEASIYGSFGPTLLPWTDVPFSQLPGYTGAPESGPTSSTPSPPKG